MELELLLMCGISILVPRNLSIHVPVHSTAIVDLVNMNIYVHVVAARGKVSRS